MLFVGHSCQNSGLRSFIVHTPTVTRHFAKHSSQRGVPLRHMGRGPPPPGPP